MDSSLKKQGVIGIVVVLVLGGGYFFFFSGSSQPVASVTETTANGAGNAFTALLTQLEPISFDTKVFADTRYSSLTDLATPITSEPGGRTDPFSPLPGMK